MPDEKLKGVETTLEISKLRLKKELPKFSSKLAMEELTNQLYDNAVENLAKQIKENEPDTPMEVCIAFAKTYFDFEFENTYDIRTQSYKLTATPIWKDINQVDTESEDYKLIGDYALSTLWEREQ